MPELRLVVLAVQDRLAYGPTFESAMSALFGGAVSSLSAAPAPRGRRNTTGIRPDRPNPRADVNALIAEAAKDLAEFQRLTAKATRGGGQEA